MAHRIKPIKKENNSPVVFWTTFILAFLGLLDAVYLLVYKLTGNDAFCAGSGGCHDVNFSRYSEIGGIPVSVFGIILLLESHSRLVKENGPLAIFGLSLSGVLFTAYLTWLEVAVIHAICPFCVATAVIISLILILAIIRLVKQTSY
jgi:uncharacterized membrane protein